MSSQATLPKFVPPAVMMNARDAINLTEKEFEVLSELLHRETGVFLDLQKAPMVQARLGKRIVDLGLHSYREYLELLRRDRAELTEFINALTTHKTDFFRENEHFEIMRARILPEITSHARDRTLRVWSAACSSGEEVYTLGVVLYEYFNLNPQVGAWDFRILGTDIDTNVVDTARAGIYHKHLLSTTRPDLLQKYFERGTGAGLDADRYRVRQELRNISKFRTHNLLDDSTRFRGVNWQIIFLRNVLIYFQPDTRELVVNKLYEVLADGGYLFLGHSENLNGIKHRFEPQPSSIYRKPGGDRCRK